MTAPAPATYTELYGTMPDVLEGDYANFMAPFAATSPEQPADLRDIVLSSSGLVPNVYLAVVNDPPSIQVIHRPTRFAPTLGVNSQWNGQIFAFTGDVGPGNQIPLVSFPPDAFTRTVEVTIPTNDQVEAQWLAAAGADCMGPFQQGDADTRRIRVRKVMAVPPAYASLCLSRVSFTLREGWTDIAGLVVQDGNADACRPLIDWLTVAGTFRPAAVANGNPQLPAVHTTLTSPVPDAELLRRVWTWESDDLPALRDRTGPASAAYDRALNTLTQEFQLRRQEETIRAAAALAPKTPASKFPELINCITTVCGVPADQLPPLYPTMAGASKSGGISAVQSLLNAAAATAGAPNIVPIVSPALYERLRSAAYSEHSVDVITSGLSIFLITMGNDDRATAARQQQVAYATIYGGNGAPNMEQVLQLTTVAPAMPPTSFAYLLQNKGYARILEVALGEHHPTCALFRDTFLPALESLLPVVEAHFPSTIAAVLPRLLRHTQIEMDTYLEQAMVMGGATPPPDLNDLLNIIRRRKWHELPDLPPRYYAPPAPARVPAPTRVPPVQLPLSPPRPDQPRQQQVPNESPVSTLVDRFAAWNHPLRELTTNPAAPLPKTDDGTDLCLSWILRCSCNSNCNRAGTHRPTSSTEQVRVVSFLDASGVPPV